MLSECENCGADFQPQDKRYILEMIVKAKTENKLMTVCYLCAIDMLKETMELLGTNIWTRPFNELYRLLFPDERSSWYVQPLMRAMTDLYLKHWQDRPNKPPRLFT